MNQAIEDEIEDKARSAYEDAMSFGVSLDLFKRHMRGLAAPLATVRQAVSDYHYALDNREHGGVAQSKAFDAICNALDMHWQQGAEKERRES